MEALKPPPLESRCRASFKWSNFCLVGLRQHLDGDSSVTEGWWSFYLQVARPWLLRSQPGCGWWLTRSGSALGLGVGLQMGRCSDCQVLLPCAALGFLTRFWCPAAGDARDGCAAGLFGVWFERWSELTPRFALLQGLVWWRRARAGAEPVPSAVSCLQRPRSAGAWAGALLTAYNWRGLKDPWGTL